MSDKLLGNGSRLGAGGVSIHRVRRALPSSALLYDSNFSIHLVALDPVHRSHTALCLPIHLNRFLSLAVSAADLNSSLERAASIS
jgi:hypothetical protein